MIERVLLLAGPPFGGELFAGVAARLRVLEPRLEVACASVPHGDVAPFAPEVEGALVVAHGLAVVAAVAASDRAAALVVSNGPVTRLDPVTLPLSMAAASPVSRAALRGALASPAWPLWLRSSLGLRRAVANPYAMDRDTVAALCAPPVADAASRRRLVDYLRWARGELPLRAPACPAVAIWGSTDQLYPASEADAFCNLGSGSPRFELAGGHFGHPEEMPWAMAEALVAALHSGALGPSRAGTATAASRSGTPGRAGQRP